MEDNFSTGWGGNGSGSNASDGEPWGAVNAALLAGLPLTFCCAIWFLTGGWGPLLQGRRQRSLCNQKIPL